MEISHLESFRETCLGNFGSEASRWIVTNAYFSGKLSGSRMKLIHDIQLTRLDRGNQPTNFFSIQHLETGTEEWDEAKFFCEFENYSDVITVH